VWLKGIKKGGSKSTYWFSPASLFLAWRLTELGLDKYTVLAMEINPAIKKFLSYAKPYRWWIIGATVCGLLKYNIPVLFPWILKDVINRLLQPTPATMSFIGQRILMLAVIYLFWTVITYYRSYLADHAQQRLIFDLRHELYGHLQRMSLSFFERRQVGSIASRLFSDISLAQNFVGAAFTNTLMDLTSLLLISILLFIMNWRLAVVSIAVFPAYIMLNKHFKKRIRRASRLAQEKMEQISGHVHERLGGISIIQSYTREKAEEQHFFEENKEYLQYRVSSIKSNALALAIIGFLTYIAPVIVIWFGATQVIRGRLTVGELAAFYAYLGMFYQPLNRLTELNISLANSQSAIERIFELFDTSPEITDHPQAVAIERVGGEIRFSGVSFEYEPSLRILNNVSIQIPANSTIALVGRSGAGKSTFVKLIPRFYDVTEGFIAIDRRDIRYFLLQSLRRQIALVSQEPILFSGDIYENILIGRPDANEKEVNEAAISAHAHDFIMDFPDGYQTEIGEGGIKLSGGQKQRIALARAFLKDSPIIILDEATSSLDSESENLIQDALKRLMKGRTTLIIAHRLSTVQAADTIVVFEKGTIVETGTHAELLQKPEGFYRLLYDEQYKNLLLEK
jgi:subfamily B ATP-binding cassette protein MsbA